MQIVTDSAHDLAASQREGVPYTVVPHTFTLDDKAYRSGVDIDSAGFYKLITSTTSFPTTSQPSPAEFAEVYRRLAATDPDILSIHVSSGLSGTFNAARLGAQMVPEANVTLYDTKSLSGAQGWHIVAAARAIQAGWPRERIVEMLERLTAGIDLMFTVATLKYLAHGGRISHIRNLMGTVLDIKPIIMVDKTEGTYAQRGTVRSLKRATLQLADLIAQKHPKGSALRAQIFHGANPTDAAALKAHMDELFTVDWMPTDTIAPVLGAHTGPGLVGIVYAPQSVFEGVPA